MIIKTYKPLTSSLRQKKNLIFSLLTKKKVEKKLKKFITQSHGRNNLGRITARTKGGGHKKLYRFIDFKRTNFIYKQGVVKSIEYDPNRNSFISLIIYNNGLKTYILHPNNLKIGDFVYSGYNLPISIGNMIPLKNIPLGIEIHNIEYCPNKGGQLCRSAGSFAKILAKEKNNVYIKLPSKKIRVFNDNCWATIGQVDNTDYLNVVLGKAGKSRWLGLRPVVRGSAMNAVDHPHGGGQGKAPIGRSKPLTPWGKPTLGVKTQRKKIFLFCLNNLFIYKFNMSRSLKKGPFIASNLYSKIISLKKGTKQNYIKTRSRSSTILPNMIGNNINLYNGKKYISIYLTDLMVGHKLGEFVETRSFKGHKKSESKNKKVSKKI